MINVVLCDASENGIHFTRELLHSCPSIEVAATANSNTQLLQVLQDRVDADLIVLDIHLPFTNSLSPIKYISEKHPSYKILVHSLADDLELITLAITFGAGGFLYKKDIVPGFMEEAITQIHRRGYYTNVIVTKEILVAAKNCKPKLPETGMFSITKKEEEVLKLLQTSKTFKEIGQELGLQKRTVEWHIENIYKKLGVTTRAGAIEIGSFKKQYPHPLT